MGSVHYPNAVGLMGAKIVFSPCAWACEVNGEAENCQKIKGMYRDRTRESNVYLIGINGVGQVTDGAWRGRILHGNSLVYGPGGECLLCGPTNQEGLLTLEVDLSSTD